MDDFKTRIERAFGTHRGAKSAAARALAVAQPQVSLAMTGKRPPSAEMLERLTRFEQGLPAVVARVKPVPSGARRTTPAPVPVAPDDSTPAQRAAAVRAYLFGQLDRLQENGWTGRDMAAAVPELFRAWRGR